MCEVQGWQVAGYYEDNNRSASDGGDRPAWNALLADIKAGTIDVIVAWNQDRAWRKMEDFEALRPVLAPLGVLFATTNVGTVDFRNPDDIFRVHVSTALSEMEVAKMRVRQLRAARQRAVRGKPKWKVAFGYLPESRDAKDDDGTRQIDEAVRQRIVDAYRAVVDRKQLTAIAQQWNKDEVRGLNGQPWSTSTLSQFLRSPRNAGLRTHNDEIVLDKEGQPVKGTWPALVDETLWRAAQTVLKGNNHGPKSVRKHLLTGVMRCGKNGCGGLLYANWQARRTGGQPGRPKAGETKQPSGYVTHEITYRCMTCYGVSVRAQHVEPVIMRALIKRLARADAAKLLRNKTFDPAEAAKLDAEEKVLLGRLGEIATERAKGMIDGVGYYRMAEIINADLAAIEGRRQDQDRLRLLDGIELGTDLIEAQVEGRTPDWKRKVIDQLMVVTIMPIGRGQKVFDHNRVDIAWK